MLDIVIFFSHSLMHSGKKKNTERLEAIKTQSWATFFFLCMQFVVHSLKKLLYFIQREANPYITVTLTHQK